MNGNVCSKKRAVPSFSERGCKKILTFFRFFYLFDFLLPFFPFFYFFTRKFDIFENLPHKFWKFFTFTFLRTKKGVRVHPHSPLGTALQKCDSYRKCSKSYYRHSYYTRIRPARTQIAVGTDFPASFRRA